MSLPTTSNVRRPKAEGYGVRIDNNWFRLADGVQPVDVVTADLQAPPLNTATGAEEMRNDFGAFFSRASFVSGEGLDFAHQRGLDDTAASRFWASEHIDISNADPGQPGAIRLLPPTAVIETSSDTNLHLAWDGTRLHMAEGTTTRRSTTYTNTTPTFADSDPHATEGAQTINDLTTLGDIMYAAIATNGLHKMVAGTWSSLNNVDTKKVWGVKKTLIVSTGTVLAESDLAGLYGSALITLPSGGTWNDVIDAAADILCLASDGNIYALADTGSGLALQAQSPMPAGEVPYCAGYDGRFVLVITREATVSGAIGRLYRFELQDHVLGNRQLLKKWGTNTTTIDQAARKMLMVRGGAYFGVYDNEGSSLWRYDSASAGLSRHLDSHTTGMIVDILSVSGRLFFTVSGHGLYREKVGSYEANGWLIGPLADFFMASDKSWAGALIDLETLPSGTSVELYYTTDPSALADPDASTWVLAKTVTDGADTGETALSGVDSRFLAGMVRLYANTAATSTPALRSFTFRAYPGHGDVEITFAVNTSDVIERPGRERVVCRGLGAEIYDWLKGREGGSAEVELLAPAENVQGVITKVATRSPDLPRKGSSTAVTLVTVRGRRIVDTDIAVVAPVAGPFKVGVLTVPATTGTQAIALTFPPKAVLFFTTGSAAAEAATQDGPLNCVGFATDTEAFAVAASSADNVSPSDASSRQAAKAIVLKTATASTQSEADCDLTTLGFTLDWTSVGAARQAKVLYWAIGGDDVQAKAVSHTAPTSATTKEVTGVGFRPEVVFHVGIENPTVPSSAGTFALSFGAMTDTDQWFWSAEIDDNETTADCRRRMNNDACLLLMGTDGVVTSKASLSSVTDDGFVLDWTTSPGAANRVFSLCLAGVTAEVGTFNASTVTPQPIEGLGMTPQTLMLMTGCNNLSGSAFAGVSWTVGVTDGTDSSNTLMVELDGVNPADNGAVWQSSRLMTQISSVSGNSLGNATLHSFSRGQFVLDWSKTNPNHDACGYVVMREA